MLRFASWRKKLSPRAAQRAAPASCTERLEARTLLNAITTENELPGTDPNRWYIGPGGADLSIQGFATDISVDRGQGISFKINDTASNPAYHIEIYRMGFYQGLGARLVDVIDSLTGQCLVTRQPDPMVDPATGLSDCGNWTISATWVVPPDATSGIYFANLVRDDGHGKSRIPFVVRDDSSRSDILFKTADATWQAYNFYGTPEHPLNGQSLYDDIGRANRAVEVSYNRPLINGDYAGITINSFFFSEYPMVRFLEKNGYDVSYFTDVDCDRLGPGYIEAHQILMSVGHDEYWSQRERQNVQAARDHEGHPVNLALFSGNQAVWETRFAQSIDGAATPDRTLVCSKQTPSSADQLLDPNTTTGMWRDTEPTLAAGPENSLTGSLYSVNWYSTARSTGWNQSITVPSTDAALRFWRNTAIARLARGRSYSTPAGYLGYEWNEDVDNGFRPPGLFDMSSTTVDVGGPYGKANGGGKLVGRPGWYERALATHSVTMFRAHSGSLVFDAGTIQWSWALNSDRWAGERDFHWYQPLASTPRPVPVDRNLQQATVNLLADMGAQPITLETGLVRATPSTDREAPVSQITYPPTRHGPQGAMVIRGTATDRGGVVAAVEVSTDGGATWHPAAGTTHWSYTWVPIRSGTFSIESRAVDDSGNLEQPAAGIVITAQPHPRTLWDGNIAPQAFPLHNTGIELGLKFTSDVAGYVTGVRFWKLPGTGGIDTGELWDSAGHLLSTATFTNETPSGWQAVNFRVPVSIQPHTVYVVSYHTTGSAFAYTPGGLIAGASHGPLHALSARSPGGNGFWQFDQVNRSHFPVQPGMNEPNVWADVIFQSPA